MLNKLALFFIASLASLMIQKVSFQKFNKSQFVASIPLDTVKPDTLEVIDSLSIEEGLYNYKLYKSNCHASYYANKFHGKRTASGEKYNKLKYTAAHRKFKFGTLVRVTNLRSGKSVIVKINDRGPHVRSREIDLSRAAFMRLAVNKGSGEMRVKLEVAHKK